MTKTGVDRAEIDAFLVTLPALSRPVINQHFRSGFHVEQKADNSPVTTADKSVETELRQAILDTFPEHAIIGEEQGGRADRQICWVIDPIDGTRSFVIGKPLFGTLVGVARDGQPFAGLIDMPVLDETYVSQGQQSCLIKGSGQTVLSASSCRQLDQAQIATTSPEAFTTDGLDKFNRLGEACHSTHYGGDCYNYALLAAGHLDLVMEHQLATHDFMALIPVLKGAGAVVTDWSGQPPDISSDGSLLVAATPELHKAAINLIS